MIPPPLGTQDGGGHRIMRFSPSSSQTSRPLVPGARVLPEHAPSLRADFPIPAPFAPRSWHSRQRRPSSCGDSPRASAPLPPSPTSRGQRRPPAAPIREACSPINRSDPHRTAPQPEPRRRPFEATFARSLATDEIEEGERGSGQSPCAPPPSHLLRHPRTKADEEESRSVPERNSCPDKAGHRFPRGRGLPNVFGPPGQLRSDRRAGAHSPRSGAGLRARPLSDPLAEVIIRADPDPLCRIVRAHHAPQRPAYFSMVVSRSMPSNPAGPKSKSRIRQTIPSAPGCRSRNQHRGLKIRPPQRISPPRRAQP